MIRKNMSILIYRKDLKAVNIGHRETMSDIGTTVADYFKVEIPENGKSFLEELE